MLQSVVIVRGDDGREFGIGVDTASPQRIADLFDEVRSPGTRPVNFVAGNFAAKVAYEALSISHRARLLTAREFNGDVGQDFTYLVNVERNRFGAPFLNVIVYLGTRSDLPVFCGATGGFRLWAADCPVAA
jgi:hypothetical protein